MHPKYQKHENLNLKSFKINLTKKQFILEFMQLKRELISMRVIPNDEIGFKVRIDGEMFDSRPEFFRSSIYDSEICKMILYFFTKQYIYENSLSGLNISGKTRRRILDYTRSLHIQHIEVPTLSPQKQGEPSVCTLIEHRCSKTIPRALLTSRWSSPKANRTSTRY